MMQDHEFDPVTPEELAERERDAPRMLGGERVNPADTGGLEHGKRGIHGQTHGVPFVRVALG